MIIFLKSLLFFTKMYVLDIHPDDINETVFTSTHCIFVVKISKDCPKISRMRPSSSLFLVPRSRLRFMIMLFPGYVYICHCDL